MYNGSPSHRSMIPAIVSAAIAANAAEAFLLYEPHLLGEGAPYALNESAQVVGYRWDPVIFQRTAMLWESSGTKRDLQPGQSSWAYDINDLNDILVANTDTGRKLILRKTETLDATGVHGRALNNLLQVVGGGGIWEAGEVRSIDGVSGMDINDRGQVAGVHSTLGAVVWEDGTITPVGPGELRYPEAGGINELGQAVGIGQNEERKKRAFYWDGVASVVLAALSGESAWAWALNDRSQIVGWSETGTRERRAVLWEDGAIADLNDLLTEPFSYTLVDAVDINNRGQIACRAEDALGKEWVVLLNPIPEPGTILLLAAGAAATLRRRRRRFP